jgi:hypothetical protein
VFRLDDLVEHIPTDIGIVKIDVEGGELEALTGMTGFVRKRKPAILIELLPVYQSENTLRLERQTRVETLFKDWSYQLFRVTKNGHDRLSGFDPTPSIGIHGNLSLCDYVAVPTDLVSLLAG